MKSSVEQFAICLYEKGFLQGNGDEINDFLEEHKAMHKEEMVDFCYYWSHQKANKDDIKQDYEQTYGGNK
jgi:hypothetical protein